MISIVVQILFKLHFNFIFNFLLGRPQVISHCYTSCMQYIQYNAAARTGCPFSHTQEIRAAWHVRYAYELTWYCTCSRGKGGLTHISLRICTTSAVHEGYVLYSSFILASVYDHLPHTNSSLIQYILYSWSVATVKSPIMDFLRYGWTASTQWTNYVPPIDFAIEIRQWPESMPQRTSNCTK